MDPLLHHELTGAEDAPCLVLSSSLGASMGMWNAILPRLVRDFRVLRYDMRGHGASPAPEGPYTVRALAEDVVRLLDQHGIETAHFCGISMGGLLGQCLAIHAPERIDRLILCNTAAKIGTEEGWNTRVEQVRQGGMASVADAIVERWLTAAFAAAHPDVPAALRSDLLRCNPSAYIEVCSAVQRCDLRRSVTAIAAPVLLIAGEHDGVCTVTDAEFLQERIADSSLEVLPAAHLSVVEAADAFTTALRRFLL